MSRIVNQNQNLLSKYIVDSQFNTHTYEDMIPSVFSVTLKASDWTEQKTQTVENEMFKAENCFYSASIPSSAERVQWVAADVNVGVVGDGEATFEYFVTKPTSDITLYITKELANLSGIVPARTTNVVVMSLETDSTQKSYTSPIPFADLCSYLLED